MPGNKVLYRDNKVLYKDNKVLYGSEGDPCCCDNDPCPVGPCNPAAYASSYAISGYSSGYFSLATCTDCQDDETGADQWDGTFPNTFGACTWFSSDGVDAISTKLLGESFVAYSGLPGACWSIEIYCVNDAGDNQLVWAGFKASGSSPAGTYLRTDGCSLRPSVVIG